MKTKPQRILFNTPSSEYYAVNTLGQIYRPHQEQGNYNTPTDGWKFLGLQHVKKNLFIPLSEIFAGEIPAPFLYKNGRPQWTVRDLDHGTTRVWGNTHAHGVRRITVEEVSA